MSVSLDILAMIAMGLMAGCSAPVCATILGRTLIKENGDIVDSEQFFQARNLYSLIWGILLLFTVLCWVIDGDLSSPLFVEEAFSIFYGTSLMVLTVFLLTYFFRKRLFADKEFLLHAFFIVCMSGGWLRFLGLCVREHLS